MARGRTGSSITRIPRAIAPLVTITTSSPARCSAAASSQIAARTSARSSPPSSATMLEPSLTTVRPWAQDKRCRSRPGEALALTGVELEDDARDLDVVAGLEARGLERADHAHRAQALLDVGERLVVVEVVAREQPLDALAATRKRPPPCARPRNRDRRPGGTPGARRAPRAPRRPRRRTGRLDGHAHELGRELVETLSGGARGDEHGHVPSRAARATPRRPPRPPRAAPGRPSTAPARAAARPAAGSWRSSSRSIVAWLAAGSEPSSGAEVEHVHEQARALDVGEEVVAEAGAGARALDQPRGCRRARAGARRASSVPSTGSSVVNG